MNERIRLLAEQAGYYLYDLTETHECKTVETDSTDEWVTLEKFADLIVRECIGILETEIELVKGYKSTACNDLDIRWHEGKIEHFIKIVEKSKKHFGVEE